MAHLPAQLAEVDPIVASFCGGAVGVLSTLMLVESNNSKMQAANRCIYCGVGHLPALSALMCRWTPHTCLAPCPVLRYALRLHTMHG